MSERQARLACRHLLVPEARTDDLVGLADSLLALHSSDPVSVHLSALARMRTPGLDAVEQALYERRCLVRHHAMRRTLWVGSAAGIRTMHAAATEAVAAAERRRLLAVLADNGVAAAGTWLAAAEAAVLDLLTQAGPLTAREIGRRAPEVARPLTLAAGKPYQAQVAAHSRVLLGLGFAGAVVRTRPVGTWVSSEYAWAATGDWLPQGLSGSDNRESRRMLAQAWLRRFGPGTTEDLAWWTGWTLATTRAALAEAGAVPVDLDGVPGWLAADDEGPIASPGQWVALLPGLDPTTMGWRGRAWYLPAAAADAFDRNGNAGPTVWVDGRVVGAWAQRGDGTIAVHWFEAVPQPRRAQVMLRAQELRDWIGPTRFTVRFPGPLHRQLSAGTGS